MKEPVFGKGYLPMTKSESTKQGKSLGGKKGAIAKKAKKLPKQKLK